MRGWWARIQYKIKSMEFQLAHPQLMKHRALEKMRESMEQRKAYERKKLEAIYARDQANTSSTTTALDKTLQDNRALIEKLRKENKGLRDKREKMIQAARHLKDQNQRLGGANTQTDGSLEYLQDHVQRMEATHKKLQVIEPKHRDKVEKVTNVVEEHTDHCVAEYRVKLLYKKLIEKVIAAMEDRCRQSELTDAIVSMYLSMEGKADHGLTLPESVLKVKAGHESFSSTSDDDSDNYDEYSVADF